MFCIRTRRLADLVEQAIERGAHLVGRVVGALGDGGANRVDPILANRSNVGQLAGELRRAGELQLVAHVGSGPGRRRSARRTESVGSVDALRAVYGRGSKNLHGASPADRKSM